jgi:hypothetical protein
MSQPKKFKLKRTHGWKAKPGNSICVLDRGAVRLEFPTKWIVKQLPDSVQIHDCEPPADNCVLGVSRFQAPQEAAGVPLSDLVAAALDGDERQILATREIVEIKREDMEIAWREVRYLEPERKKDAFSRLAICRGSGVHCLITFDFWADQAAQFVPVWDEALRSLVLGLYIEDPATGPRVH